MSVITRLRQVSQSDVGHEAPVAYGAPPWIASFVFHALLLFVLGSITLLLPTASHMLFDDRPLEIDLTEPPPIEEVNFSPDAAETIGAMGGVAGGVENAQPTAAVEVAKSNITYDLGTTPDQPTALSEPRLPSAPKTILEAPNLSENLMVTGASSIGTSGAVGAVDRITQEILLSLEVRPTLVIWLFDESGSLKAQREAIAKRFDHVYDELNAIQASGNSSFKRDGSQPLLTVVAAFGESAQLITPKPTDKLEAIKTAVRGIADDASGTENVFQSVSFVAEKFRHFRLQTPQRNVMIVVFTDEAGDDVDHLDSTVAYCRKLAIPVYVVGVPAPFGRQDAYIRWTDPDPKFDQSPQWILVHQGPESLMSERLKLNFAGESEHDPELDSGFGPFGLCRLTTETSGLYFTVHPNRKGSDKSDPSWDSAAYASNINTFFDERAMRKYRPDYVSVEQYKDLLSANRAYGALVEASALSFTTEMENPRLRFPKVDDSQLAREMSVAQRNAAKLEPRIEQLVAIMRKGETDRPKVTKPRWQAGFDLAIGRALAVKVRTEGYNAMLAAAKQGMKFKNDKDDTWILRPDQSVTINSALAKDADDAKKYLKRVVADHPGTPWAMEAAEELKDPLGWRWDERFTDVAGRMAERQQQGKPNRPKPEPTAPPAKPRRDPPKL